MKRTVSVDFIVERPNLKPREAQQEMKRAEIVAVEAVRNALIAQGWIVRDVAASARFMYRDEALNAHVPKVHLVHPDRRAEQQPRLLEWSGRRMATFLVLCPTEYVPKKRITSDVSRVTCALCLRRIGAALGKVWPGDAK